MADETRTESVHGAEAGEAPLCPACGYDLRASADLRCPECGMQADPEELRTSGFPFAHRRRRGWLRSYLATCWQVSRDAGHLRYQVGRPQEARDGRAFRRATGVLLGLALVGWLLAAIPWATTRWNALAVQRSSPLFASGRAGAAAQDLAVPWSAGAMLVVPLPAGALLLGLAMAAAPARAVRPGHDASATSAGRAEAIASYAAGPLLLTAAGLAWAVGFGLLLGPTDDARALPQMLPCAGAGLGLLVVGAIVWRALGGRDAEAGEAGEDEPPAAGASGGWAGAVRRSALIVGVLGLMAAVLFEDALPRIPVRWPLQIAGWAVAAAGVTLALARTALWHGRITGRGAGAALLAAAEVLGRWLLAAVVLLALVPWCVGFLYLALDSLR